MAIKLKTTGEFNRAIKALRKYADGFDTADGYDLRQIRNPYDNPLTKSQKAKVARYFDVLQRHAGYKGTNYQHFTDPKRLASAQKAMGMPSRSSWRGVFVPQPSDATPAKLVEHKGQWVIEYTWQGVDTVFIPFDKLAFATYGTEYVAELLGDLPSDYRYNLDMGHGRNRWKAGGNLEQVLRDLDFIVSGYGHFAEFVMGVHVYRGGMRAFNKLKTENAATMDRKKITQKMLIAKVRKERRTLKDYMNAVELREKGVVSEHERLMRKFPKLFGGK